MKSMATLWDDMRFLAGETEGKTERLETDGALVVVVWSGVRGDNRDGRHARMSVGVGLAVAGALCVCRKGRTD